MQHIQDFSSFINEARVSVKRKYTDAHPERYVSDYAPIREKVLNWVGEKGSVTKAELSQFLNGINEENGKGSGSKWLSRNIHLFKVKESNGENTYTLSNMGVKVREAIIRSRERRVNELEKITQATKEDFTDTKTA